MVLGDTVRAEMAQDPQFQQRVVISGTKHALWQIGTTFDPQAPGANGVKFAEQQKLAAQWVAALGTFYYGMPSAQVPKIITRVSWAVASSFTTATEHPDINDLDLDSEIEQVWPALASAVFDPAMMS